MTQKKERISRRKSDPGTVSYRQTQERSIVAAELPWGAPKIVTATQLDVNQPTGLYACQSVLADLFAHFDRKIQQIVEEEPIEKLINKTVQRGADAYLDNLCHTLHAISEVCLPAVLKSLIDWHQKMEYSIKDKITPANEARHVMSKKLLAVNYLMCLVLIEVLPQVEFHLDVCQSQIKTLLDLSFIQVQYKDPAALGVNNANYLVVAETYGEVIGVISTSHFTLVHKQFMSLLNDLKKDTSPTASQHIISFLMAMKFVKIKTNQVEDFEQGIKFLDDLATYFLEVKDKDVKHSVTGLLVEILLPVAAQIKREANIPALITLVTKLYGPANEMASKKQHKLAAFPLVTCLLCVSQRQFFFTNWGSFLTNNILQNLKNRDPRISRISLESLYRLLWVYMIRNSGDGNTATRSRLESICGSLFPKGNRYIVPRDAPLNIFVKIIHFIAQQKLDFAFKEVIFDLLCCNRTQRSLYPERMNIGIRALMVIADGLQQKDQPPGMPKSMGPSASGTIQRVKKKTYIQRPLTADIAKSIGLDQYYTPCRKAFDSILRILDTQIGKPLMMINAQNKGKEADELTNSDSKPKIDLFRTCVAAIPRLLPEPMTPVELIDILTRLTVHLDLELRNMAGMALQNIINEFPEWREHVFNAQVQFFNTQLTDFHTRAIDDALRLLLQMVGQWKIVAIAEKKREQEKTSTQSTAPPTPMSPLYGTPSSTSSIPSGMTHNSSHSLHNQAYVLHSIEGLALVMLCQYRSQGPVQSQPRKISISILKEIKCILEILGLENCDVPVINVLDEATPYVVRKYIEHVPLYERLSWQMDFATVTDKIFSIETDNCLVNSDKGNEYFQWDPWACALSGYAERRHLLSRCPTAVLAAWPILFARLNAISGYVDLNNPQNESRASLLRGSKSKSSVYGEAIGQHGCLSLWQKYLTLCCAFAPSSNNPTSSFSRSFSPTNSESEVFRSMSSIRSNRPPAQPAYAPLLTKACTMLRWEHMTDMRDNVVLGVGSMNPLVFESFIEELRSAGILREAMEKKPETNVRRRKRKDLLRLQLLRIIELSVYRGLLEASMIDSSGCLNSTLLDFIDSLRIYLETVNDSALGDKERERDAVLTTLRLHLGKTVVLIVDSVSPTSRTNLIPDERKQSLFYLFLGWCSRTVTADKKAIRSDVEKEVGSYVEQKAALAMTRLLCCGPIFEASKSIGEDGYLYGWLEKLVAHSNPSMHVDIEEMLAWMLELNESSNLLDWLMAQCYSQPLPIASRCFRALVRVFSRRDFPCEFVSLFVLCQAMAVYPSLVDQTVHMLEILKRQFLDTSANISSPLNFSAVTSSPPQPAVPLRSGLEQMPSVTVPADPAIGFSIEQLTICHQLAKAYPHLSITIFSEVSSRIEQQSCAVRSSLLSMLIPWIENLELVDPLANEDTLEGPRGWGSEEATQLLLNNLMYMTAQMSSQHSAELANLWRGLALAFPANLPVLLNYLYVVVVLNHETLLSHAKTVIVMLSSAVGNRLASLLLEWLTISQDSSRATIERSEIPPYYRWKDENGDNLKAQEPLSLNDGMLSAEGRQLLRADDSLRDGVRLLPMPAYGGHYAQMSNLLPPATQPLQFFTKSEVALLLICDLIRSSGSFDWTASSPRLLHSAVLSLDSLRPALCKHARQTLINVCLLYADRACLPQLSAVLLRNQISDASRDRSQQATCLDDSTASCSIPRGDSPTFAKAAADEYRSMLLHSNATFSTTTDLITAIVFCLSENMESPLWPNEDVTPRNWKVPSATQLACLVRHLAELILPSIPLLPVLWTQIAMKMALASNQRHVAGRCFQIVTSLCQPLTAWVPSLISRLAETTGETHEDTQAYVTDLLLCLISCAPHLSPIVEAPPVPSVSPNHARSTSYTPALLRQSLLAPKIYDKKDARMSLFLSEDEPWPVALVRSKSADQLKTDEAEEETTARMQLCAIALALLDSSIENEFILALNLLEKVLDVPFSLKVQCLQKLEKTVAQLDWKSFYGITHLITRGAVVVQAYELSLQAMLRLIDVLNECVVGGNGAFGLLTAHLLPYMMLYFETPTQLCTQAAAAIKQYCISEVSRVDGAPADHPFTNLATVMTQYSTKTFTKDRFQWAKCVMQYVCQGLLAVNVDQMLVLLAEMADRSAASLHVYILHIIALLIQHRDPSSSSLPINAQVVRCVSRHVQAANWHEAAQIYKSVIEQWVNVERDKNSDAPSTQLTFDVALLTRAATARETSPPSPRRNQLASTGGVPNVDPNATTSLKRQPPSHVRVRERLVGLLSAFGLRVGGLPSAHSTAFINSEIGSASSSTERICPSSQEFDFLEAEHDSVSETADSCFGWLTMRRQTQDGLGMEENEEGEDVADEDEDSEGAQECSEEGGVSNSRMSRTSASSDRTPCPSEGEDEEDDAFDVMSSGRTHDPIDVRDRLSPKLASIKEGEKRGSRERVDDETSSFCGRSIASSIDYYPNHQHPPLTLQCINHLDGGGKVCCGRVCSLMRDASHVLSSKTIARVLTSAQHVLAQAADSPFLFLTSQFLRSSGVLQRLKLSIYEMREHMETFNERNDFCLKALNAVRSAHKLSTLHGSNSSIAPNGESELGKLLSKLFFQIMLMSDSLIDIIRTIKESNGAQTYSLSPAVLDHQRELLLSSTDAGTPTAVSTPSEYSGDSLVLFMANKRYRNALLAVRQLRLRYGSEYGCCEAVDIDVLLLLFCRSHSLKAWALVGGTEDSMKLQSQALKNVNADMSSLRHLPLDHSSPPSTLSSFGDSSFSKLSYSRQPTEYE
ncbi:hypothetical protein WR25_11823 [Diploscapter pachys]|uniref:Cell morphogenesis protein N-terminal domain-containing protein n=1 Tax=Diploscapter pachys TaxID=2018661 RepID=A0A2A2KLI7_9BILA|nr:hypothetical protein WR25_11823 [Diploscapter pachys]